MTHHVMLHLAHVVHHVTCHVAHVTHHVAHVMHHVTHHVTSHVTCHVTRHVTRHVRFVLSRLQGLLTYYSIPPPLMGPRPALRTLELL